MFSPASTEATVQVNERGAILAEMVKVWGADGVLPLCTYQPSKAARPAPRKIGYARIRSIGPSEPHSIAPGVYDREATAAYFSLQRRATYRKSKPS